MKTQVVDFGHTIPESLTHMAQFTGLPVCEKHIAVSPNGRLVLIQGETCRLYDIESGKLLTELKPRSSMNARAWFSRCGNLFGTGGTDSLFNIWSVANHRDIAKTCLDDEQLTRVVTSRHSSVVGLVTVDQYVAFYCRARDEQVGFPDHISKQLSVEGDAAFDHDGLLVVAERELGELDSQFRDSFRLFRMPNGEPYGVGNIPMAERISAFRLSTDARTLVAWDYDQPIQAYDTTTGQQLWSSDYACNSYRKVTFSESGQHCLVWSDDKVVDYRDCRTGSSLDIPTRLRFTEQLSLVDNDPAKFARIYQFLTARHLGRSQFVGFRRQQSTIASTRNAVSLIDESKVSVFDYEAKHTRELPSPIRYMDSIACSDNGSVVAACGYDSTAVAWKLGELKAALPDSATVPGIRRCFPAPTFGLAALLTGDELSLFDLASHQLTTMNDRSFHRDVTGCWRNTAKQLLIASDSQLATYDIESQQWSELSAFEGEDIIAVAFSSDDRLLALGYQDNRIEIVSNWHTPTPTIVATLPDIIATQLSFSSTAGQLYVSDSGGAVWQWNYSTEPLPALIFETSESRRISSFSLREDLHLVVISLCTPAALFVDLTSGSVLRALSGAHCPRALAAGLRYTVRSSDRVEVVDHQTGVVIDTIGHALDTPVWLGKHGFWAGVDGTVSPLVLQLPETQRSVTLPEIASPWTASSRQPSSLSPHLVITQLRVRLRRWIEITTADLHSLRSVLNDTLHLIQSVVGEHETAEQSLQIRESLGFLLGELTAAIVIVVAEAKGTNELDTPFSSHVQLSRTDEETRQCLRDFIRICFSLSNWMLRGTQCHTIALNDETKAEVRQRCDRIAELLSKYGHEKMFPVHVSQGKYLELNKDQAAIEYALLHAQVRGDEPPEPLEHSPAATIGFVPVAGLDDSSANACFLSMRDHFLLQSESMGNSDIRSLLNKEAVAERVQWIDLSGKNTSFHVSVNSQCDIAFQSAGASDTVCIGNLKPAIVFWGGYDFDGIPLQVEDRKRRISHPETGVEFQFPQLDALATSERDFGPLPLAHYERWSLQDIADGEHCELREFGPGKGTRHQFLEQDWKTASILHLSTHGKVHVADRMLADFVVHNDERITYFDVLCQDWSSFDLVFLNCCLSAEGGTTTGDETLSIASAFLRGGAGTVIAHRHKIKDAAAALFARAFYANLLVESADQSIARAFRAGVQAVKAFPGFDDPQIWGSFMKYDNPFRRSDQET